MLRILLGAFAGFGLALLGVAVAPLVFDRGSSASPEASSLLTLPSGKTVVKQGSARITTGEFRSVIDSIPADDRAGFLSSSDRLDKMLGDLLLVRLMAIDGIEAGLLESPKLVGALRQEILSFLGQKQARAIKQNAELDDYSELARERYLANREQYMLPEKVDFTQLFLADREGRNETRLIEEIYKQLEAGEAFDALVREYSDESNREGSPGRYEDAKLSKLDGDFAAKLRALESSGDISEPFQTQFGWHIVRLDDYQSPKQQSFEDVEEKLKREVRTEVRNRALRRYGNRLISENEPRVDIDVLKNVLANYGVDLPGSVSVHQESTGDNG